MNRQKYRIIVEGMDGSGKTTLIRQLMGLRIDLGIVRNDLEDKMDFNKWWPKVVDAENNKAITPIHDRFYYSELVYGPVIRGRLSPELQLIANMAWFLRSNSFLIYSRPHTDQIRESLQKSKHMEGVTEKFDELVKLYDEIMDVEKQWYGERFFHYVWTREGELERLDRTLRRYTSGDLG